MFEFLNETNGYPFFFAGDHTTYINDYIIENNGLRLYSYVNDLSSIKKRINQGLKTFIDSGAFTAMSKGIDFDVDKYIEFLNNNSEHFHLFSQYDTIPNEKINPEESAELTWQNYKYMKARLKEPHKLLYVYHVDEPFEYLERILNDEEDVYYIAIGGLVKKRGNNRKRKIEEIFNIIKKSKRPNINVHAFGLATFSLLEEYPFTSADSTTWIYFGRLGNLECSIGRINVSDKLTNEPNHYNKLTETEKITVLKEVETRGYDFPTLQKCYKERIKYRIDDFIRWSKNYKYTGKY